MNSGMTAEAAASKRFIAHDFLIGSPVLIDRAEQTMTFFHNNIHG